MGPVARGIKGEVGGLELSVPSPALREGKKSRRLNGQWFAQSRLCNDASTQTRGQTSLKGGGNTDTRNKERVRQPRRTSTTTSVVLQVGSLGTC